MLQILENKDNLISTKATGTLTEEDYNTLIPMLEEKIENNQKVRWYFEMEDFDGWKVKALWEDAKFDAKHINDFEKIAMVGEKKWEKVMTDLMKPFTSADVKYFDAADKAKAINWIKS
ncbi:MAG: STAS/SEC14 domain-containing protein [Candidatus Cyclobacteriaceae bacterium M2_1C_046]